MTKTLILYLLGWYFIGISISIVRNVQAKNYNITVDLFKLIVGILMLVSTVIYS
jgi:hypothetical protein